MSAMAGEQRKPGRPRSQGRINATVRFTPETYEAVRTAAKVQGRSISEEIENRIQQSFQNEALIPVLNALLSKEGRAGEVLGGWLATELRAGAQRGNPWDESIAIRFGEVVKDYFGREKTGEKTP
jgi:Arc-like DNA binding domain